MTKKRAYTSKTGNQTVTAQAVLKERNRFYGGAPTGKSYYSMHPAGERKDVVHVRKGSGYFAYKRGDAGHGGAAEGESLNHILFKEALCSVSHTKLVLYRQTPGAPALWRRKVPITVQAARAEEPVPRRDGPPYRADVYLEFATDDDLGLKWQRRVYIEIRHAHAVDARKQDELRTLGIPVVEVDINHPAYMYPFSDDETTDEREDAHRKRLKHMLEHENGFLQGVVLSNPSSNEYLQKLVGEQRRKLDSQQAELDRLAAGIAERDGRLAAAAEAKLQSDQRCRDARAALERVSEQLSAVSDERTRALRKQQALAEQLARVRAGRRVAYGGCAALVALAAVLGYAHWQRPPALPAARPAPLAQAPAAAAGGAQRATGRAAASPQHRSRPRANGG